MSIRYIRPRQLTEALEALAEYQRRAWVLAGGTDLLVRMRQGVIVPEVLVDVSGLRELSGIRWEDGRIQIGALTTYREIEACADIKQSAPELWEACHAVGAPQIRSRGTLGGNLGNASPAGDSLPALYVLEGQVELLSLQGTRWVTVQEFFTGPGQTVRRADELIGAIQFQPLETGARGYFRKIGQRQGMFIAKASVAANLVLQQGVVRRCRIGLGAVAPTVIRAREAETYLQGRELSREVRQEAGRLAAAASRPITDIRSTAEYRRHIVGVLVARGLEAMALQATDQFVPA